MCTQDLKFWKHTRGHSPLGLVGSIRILIVAKLQLFSEDIQSRILGMLLNLHNSPLPHAKNLVKII